MPKRTANNGSFKAGNKGRPPGPNKVTQATRETFQLLVDQNFGELQSWISTVAAEDPARAFDMVMALASHCIPKLKAIEVSGPGGNAITLVINAPHGGPIT